MALVEDTKQVVISTLYSSFRRLARSAVESWGMRKGGEAPLAGGADGTSRASGVGWRGTCVGVGGTVPAPAFPPGKRERGIRFLAAAGDLISAEADVCSSLAHPRPRRLASLTLYGPAANQS